jgi:hypothetical protein
VILLPSHLAEAIEWVLRPTREERAKPPPDLSRLTSEQMQLLPLAVAQDFMELTLAALQTPPARRKPGEAPQSSRPREMEPDTANGGEASEANLPPINDAYIAQAPTNAPGQWPDRFNAKSRQRTRRYRQRADTLTAAHERLCAWYLQTASAVHRGFTR